MARPAMSSAQLGGLGDDDIDPGQVGRIVGRHRGSPGALIAALQDIQSRYGYLPRGALQQVADETGRSLVDVYGIATFYRSFTLQPRGEHLISACLGTACHVRGAARIVGEFEHQLGIRVGQTTSDRQFTLETVNCLGACALGPIVVVDGHYFCNVKPSTVAEIIERARRGLDDVEAGGEERAFPLQVRCPRCNHGLMDSGTPVDSLASIRLTVGFGEAFSHCNLSCLYGSLNSACGAEIPEGTICDFFCPHCHRELAGRSRCTECGAPMAPMIVRGGGILHVCTRRGCHTRRLDL